jgi:nicotinate-nucleotide--dimethylbenzimidazole phosphoribosyltransferase
MLYGPAIAMSLVLLVVILLTSGVLVHYYEEKEPQQHASSSAAAVIEIVVLIILQQLQDLYGAPGQGLLTLDGSFSQQAQSIVSNVRQWNIEMVVQFWRDVILVEVTSSQIQDEDPNLVLSEEEGWMVVSSSIQDQPTVVSNMAKTLIQVDPNTRMGILLRLGLVLGWTVVSYTVMGRWLGNGKKTETSTSSSLNNDNEIEGNESSLWGEAVDKASASVQFRRAKVNQILQQSTVSFEDKYMAVQEYLDSLAKPVGALGTLEDWAARLASLQGTLSPIMSNNDSAVCLIFAGDHGVARAVRDGGAACSAFPQSATRTMLAGLEAEVAASSILAKRHNVTLQVIDVGVDGEPYNGRIVRSSPDKIVGGTRNFLMDAAMSMKELERCLTIGRNQAKKWGADHNVKVIALGEVGIGNTTSSSALIAALTKSYPKSVCGVGAMRSHKIDSTLIDKKIEIVRKALQKHCNGLSKPSPKEICARLGGTEIAAMVGVILEASERNIAVLIDGFIVTAAALVAAHLQPTSIRCMFFCSRSKEPGQAVALQSISDIASKNKLRAPSRPALDIDLRQGEGAGATLGTTLLRDTSSIMCNMATLQQVTKKWESTERM